VSEVREKLILLPTVTPNPSASKAALPTLIDSGSVLLGRYRLARAECPRRRVCSAAAGDARRTDRGCLTGWAFQASAGQGEPGDT